MKLAADKDGNVTAVWSAQEGTGAVHLWSNRYVPSTGWGDPRVVDSEGTSAQEIQLSVSRAGHAALVWLQQDSAKKAWVWGNQYMSGAGWSGPAKLKADSVHASERPYVGVDPAGNAMAVWHQSDGTRTNIWSNRFQPSVGWGTALTIDSSDEGCSGARVVLRDDGSAIVAFQQNSSTRPLLYWNEYAPMATREWGTAVYLRADFVGSPSEPLLAADVAGNLMAVWSQTNLGPRPVSSLYASRRQSAGGWEKSEPIGSAYSTEVRDLELAMNAAGGVITVWTQSDGTRDTVFANRYEPNVGWGKASSLFEPQQKSPGSKPAVAINDAGDAIVVWQSADQGQTSLIYRRFQLGNGWLAATTLVESDDTYPSEPRVVLAADGRVMVAWNESRAGSARAFATSF